MIEVIAHCVEESEKLRGVRRAFPSSSNLCANTDVIFGIGSQSVLTQIDET